MLLSGVITSFDDDSLSWIVNVESVSVTSGSVTRTVSNLSPNKPNGPSRTRTFLESKRPKPNLTSHQSMPSAPVPNQPGPSIAHVNSVQTPCDDSIMQVDDSNSPNPTVPRLVEDGEVFENTFPKKRTTKDIISNAKKRMRHP